MALSSIKKFFLGSVRSQLITGVALVNAVLMSAFIYDLMLRQEKTLIQHQAKHAIALAQTLAVSSAGWWAANDIAGLKEILHAQKEYPELVFALLTDTDGNVLSHTGSQKLELKLIDMPATANPEIIEETKALIDVAVPVMLAGRHVGWARVGFGTRETRQEMKKSVRDGILFAFIAIFIGSLLVWVIGSKITNRLYAIQNTINAVKAGSHDSRTRLSGTDEAVMLAAEFNAMLDALSQRDAQLQETTDELRYANLNLERIVLERTQQVSTSLAQVEKREFELKMAQNVAHIGSWILDIAKNVLTWSDETYTIFGIETSTPLNLELFADRIHPDDQDRVLEAWTDAMTMTGSPYDIEHRILVNGQIKWVHEKAQMQFDENGKAISGIGTVQDITERKRLEQHLQDIIDLDQKIVEASPIGIFACRADGPCLLANPAIARISGTSVDNILKLNFHNLDNWKKHGLYEEVMTVLNTQEELRTETHIATAFGKTVWLKYTVTPFTFSGEKHFLMLAEDISDIKQYEIELKEREELYRSMFNSHSIMLLIDPETDKIEDANQAACEFYGYSYNRMLKLLLTDINTAPPEIVHERMYDVKQGKQKHFDFVHRLSDGTLRNVEAYCGSVRFHGKTLLHSIIFDVTQRRQAEETTQRLAAIIESSNDAIVSETLDGKITIWNKAAEELFGYTAREAIGMDIAHLWPEAIKDDELAIIPLIKEGLFVSQYESKRLRSDGTAIDVSITIFPIYDVDGEIVAASEIIRDITDRKRTERKIAEAEERLRTIFDRSPDAYLLMELEKGRINDCNPATEAILGGTRDQIIGMTPDEISPDYQPDGRTSSAAAADKIEQCLHKGSLRFEWIHRRFDGSYFWADVSLVVMRLSGRQALFASWRDISERKRMEQELDRTLKSLAESNKELEHFAYIASHDLQEPLRMVSSYVQLLSQRYKDQLDADANDFIGYAVDGATRMKGMIDALLSYARVNTRGRELMPIDSGQVLADALKNLELAIEDNEATVLCDPLPRINADEIQLGQLFQNLISNAIKFKKPDAPPQVRIGAQREHNVWHFTIADNGIGIDLTDNERIFLIFQRLHTRQQYPGTGIGLALCKKIVERHGGRIWVESEKDAGCTIHFTMPAIEEASIAEKISEDSVLGKHQ